MKDKCIIIGGILGGIMSALVGGLNHSLNVLILLMIIDYFTGMIVAGIFKKSTKSENGGLQSNVGFKGLAKKVGIFALIIVAYQLESIAEVNFIKDTVILAFIVNELVSILENAGLMGIPIPNVLTKAVDVLKNNEK